MKISEQWLRTWVNPSISTEEMVEQLTMAGLEVDGTEPAAGEFTDVVVAKVESVEKHPVARGTGYWRDAASESRPGALEERA